MKKVSPLLILVLVTLVFATAIFLMKPIPQSLAYHSFADQRSWWGVPNFLNVISNVPFLFVGIYGLLLIKKSVAPRRKKVMYSVLFAGIFLTGLGSAWYHLSPDNDRLVYDRLPMTIVFMSFLAAIISGWIHSKAGTLLLLPLLALGTGSVLWWHYTELHGAGDLRLYAFVQFYPMLFVPLIFFLYASSDNNKGLYLLAGVIIWYGVAKFFEVYDEPVYKTVHFVSGHSLKHITAAIATWYLLKFFEKKYVEKKMPVPV